MKFLYSLTGSNHPVIKEFTINPQTVIKAGELVVCNPTDNSFGTTPYGTAVGVAAEDHTGEKDILNPRNDGDKLRIDITRGGVYEVEPFTVTATTGSNENTLIIPWSYLNATLDGSSLVLKEKSEDSMGGDKIGTITKITALSLSDSMYTLTLSEGANVCVGDVFYVLPREGFVGSIDSDRKGFTPTGSYSMSAKVVKANADVAKLEVTLDGKMFD